MGTYRLKRKAVSVVGDQNYLVLRMLNYWVIEKLNLIYESKFIAVQ